MPSDTNNPQQQQQKNTADILKGTQLIAKFKGEALSKGDLALMSFGSSRGEVIRSVGVLPASPQMETLTGF